MIKNKTNIFCDLFGNNKDCKNSVSELKMKRFYNNVLQGKNYLAKLKKKNWNARAILKNM